MSSVITSVESSIDFLRVRVRNRYCLCVVLIKRTLISFSSTKG